MAETPETLARRLDQLEKTVEETSWQLSWLFDELFPEAPKNFKTGTEVMAYYGRNKKRHAKVFREMREKMGISGEPIPAEALQARMVRNGIRMEDNEFSSAIIEEREE